MRFAQYLEDNCTPEWKRLYISYRLLKEQIRAIAERQILVESGKANLATYDFRIQDKPRGGGAELGQCVSEDEGVGSDGGQTRKRNRRRRNRDAEGEGNHRDLNQEEQDVGLSTTSTEHTGSSRQRTIGRPHQLPGYGRAATLLVIPQTFRPQNEISPTRSDQISSSEDGESGPQSLLSNKVKRLPMPARVGSHSSATSGNGIIEENDRLTETRRKAGGRGRSFMGTIEGSPSIEGVAAGEGESQHREEALETSRLRRSSIGSPMAKSASTPISTPPLLTLPDGAVEGESTASHKRTGATGRPRRAWSHGRLGQGVFQEEAERVFRNSMVSSTDGEEGEMLRIKASGWDHWTRGGDLNRSSMSIGTPMSGINGNTSETVLIPKSRKDRMREWMSEQGSKGTEGQQAGSKTVRYPKSIHELYKISYPDEREFFRILDEELDKVEDFYHQRETETLGRGPELKRQLKDLAEHRRIYHVAGADIEANTNKGKRVALMDAGLSVKEKILDPRPRKALPSAGKLVTRVEKGDWKAMKMPGRGDVVMEKRETLQESEPANHAGDRTNSDRKTDFDPETYQKCKKALRGAIQEYYKELEILKNYRILNLTGFKKALKKFEKIANLRSLDLYMDEKISKRSFAKGRDLDDALKSMEQEYTIHFEDGNYKKAIGRLRGYSTIQTHHRSVFSSGTYVGIGLPGLILGIVAALSTSTRQALPQYGGVLQVYATLFIPLVFAMLFQLNLSAWVSARINYAFIMGLDQRAGIDHRQYIEIPALLFAALCWCFMFTMYEVGAPAISPFTWPLVWLVFFGVFILNPIPVFHQPARYWFISTMLKTLTPGYTRVGFIAFFLADELNSLTYPIASIWFLGCAYNKGWNADIYAVCPSNQNWVYGLLLSVPAFIRLIQSVKRWKDSGLKLHLINAGKYFCGMAYYSAFIAWRSRGSAITDPSFAVFASIATVYSTYASAWDLYLDWGLLRRKYGYLRENLGYSKRWIYYGAMFSNVVIRFIWLFYIPGSTGHTRLRSFIFACLEMLRRWQWNFFRVETEQMGNTDSYRVTREIPLPYHRNDDGELDNHLARSPAKYGLQSIAVKLGQLRYRLGRRRSKDGKGVDSDDEESRHEDDEDNDVPPAGPERQ